MNLSPAAWRRIVPFAVFMLLLAVRGALPADGALDPRWLYTLTVVMVGGLLLWWWRDYGELSRANAPTVGEVLLSVVVGLVVFALWITLDAPWMRLGEASASFDGRGPDDRPDWSLVVPRWIGAALLVPVMEELFWRSFLMRWIAKPQFEAVPPAQVGFKAIVLSTFVFMLAHTLWLAAIVAGLAYALLYVRTGKLWTAVIAHAVTNGVLGAWVVATNRWEFW